MSGFAHRKVSRRESACGLSGSYVTIALGGFVSNASSFGGITGPCPSSSPPDRLTAKQRLCLGLFTTPPPVHVSHVAGGGYRRSGHQEDPSFLARSTTCVICDCRMGSTASSEVLGTPFVYTYLFFKGAHYLLFLGSLCPLLVDWLPH